ncbi:uncharacterized protein LOC104432600 isoform X2 [Eucalyptus grandis]|uniref:uncharacterized protein LOC104432600 isoform X2 n=1 Tax=Eucalyptus grandis TaxID=71139 RepID=UPI00192EACDD|nr:uncharacterized protein LOC104432600 isoform X2 [Eucalyptus grandis]
METLSMIRVGSQIIHGGIEAKGLAVIRYSHWKWPVARSEELVPIQAAVCGLVMREKSTGRGENLLMVKETISQKHTWEVNNFLKLDKEFSESKVFIAGNEKWKI